MIALLRRFDVGAQIALLALLAAYFMVWPVWRAGFPIEIAQNEGWNAYHADAAMGAAPLYPATDTLIVNNYPPLSFYVVGEIAKATGIDALYVGRVMSLIAVVALGALIAKVISQLGGGRAGAALGGVWYVAVMARSFTRFVGMNDPQLVGHALMVAALAWFLARDMRKQSAVPPFLAMAAIGFYKHNIIAVPVTALLWLLVQDWRRAVWPAIAGAAAAAVGLAICVAIYGDVFLANLITARPSSFTRAIYGLGRLQWILPALVLWAIWIAAEPKSRAARFTMIHVGVSFVAFVLQWSGEAILDNAQFDLVIATAIGIGLAFDRAGATAFGTRYGETPARAVITLVLVVRLLATLRIEFGAGAVRSRLPRPILRERRSSPAGRRANCRDPRARRLRFQGGLPHGRKAVLLRRFPRRDAGRERPLRWPRRRGPDPRARVDAGAQRRPRRDRGAVQVARREPLSPRRTVAIPA